MLKQAIKRGLAWILDVSGVLRLWHAWAFRDAAIVLMYHRVLSPDERRRTGSHPAIVVSAETFAMHMAVLRRRFTVLSLEEFSQRLERGEPFPSGACLITFDDGWSDNFVNAWPVLREHGLPATIFLPVHYIGSKRLFWREAVTHVLVQVVGACHDRPELRARCAAHLEPFGLAHVLEVEPARARAATRLALAEEKHATPAAIERLIAALAREVGLDVHALQTPDTFIDWDQVAAMARGGMSFGGHGAEHYLLTDIPLTDADQDIRASKTALDAQVPSAVAAFAYPNGNWSPQIAARVRAAGYQLAFTTNVGLVRPGDDPLTLKRVNIHEGATCTAPLFVARLLGVL